jgi:hypothetical protein
MKTNIFLISLTGIILLLVSSCKKEEPATIPVLSTSEVTGVTGITAICGGNITYDGGAAVIAYGVCWSTNVNPTINDLKTIQNIQWGQFVSSINGLNPGTTYHVRAYATNSVGTAYGSDIIFTTLEVPNATTEAATNISATGATLNGTVYSSGLPTIVTFEYGITTSYGQEITAVQSPVTGNASIEVSAILTGLTEGTYHFRVKTINSVGTVYGDDMEFTMCSCYFPTVALLPATNITPTGVTLNGTVNANGSQTIVTFLYSIIGIRGEGWKTVIADESPVTGYGITNVRANISGLTPGSTHEFYISATNSCGTTVTNYKLSFAGCSNFPTVAILPATNISATGVTLNGAVNANRSETTVTFLYSSAGCFRCPPWFEVTAAESPVNGNGITNVSANVSGLHAGSTHKFYITATNICGTFTSDQLSFTIPN